MRQLDELPGTFDVVICMWASFGWFADETNAEDGSSDTFEWRLYEPEELAALGAAAGLRQDAVCAGYSEVPPTGDTARTQLVFRRDT